MRMDRNVGAALGAAVLFGLSMPLAKMLVGDVPPLLLAGLLYVGSGLGLAILLAGSPRRRCGLRHHVAARRRARVAARRHRRRRAQSRRSC